MNSEMNDTELVDTKAEVAPNPTKMTELVPITSSILTSVMNKPNTTPFTFSSKCAEAPRIVRLSGSGTPATQLIWQDGRLQCVPASSPGASTTTIAAANSIACPPGKRLLLPLPAGIRSAGKVDMRARALQAPSTVAETQLLQRGLFPITPRSTGRGRRKSSLAATEGCSEMDNIEIPTSKSSLASTSQRNRVCGKKGRSENTKEAILLLPIRQEHAPTDTTLPPLYLRKEDPFNPTEGECAGTTNGATVQSTSTTGQPSVLISTSDGHCAGGANTGAPNANAPSGSSRMKSSGGFFGIDLNELRHYRRLNGHTLFALVNKKKYLSSLGTGAANFTDDPMSEGLAGDSLNSRDNQGALNRRWQALWSTLPEKSRREWKVKARRLSRLSQREVGRGERDSQRREKEKRRIHRQLSRTELNSFDLTDVAAHFQLLSDVFRKQAKQLDEYSGPVLQESVDSMLLDGLLTCLIPLVSLVGTELPGTPDTHVVCQALNNLAYIVPTM